MQKKSERRTITVKQSECVKLGEGSQKIAYKFGNRGDCFLRPFSDEPHWDWLEAIEREKKFLDQILSLGLKAQNFEIVNLNLEKGRRTYSFPVLLTKDFQSLCEEESMIIYNRKGTGKAGRVIGGSIARAPIMKSLQKEEYAQGLVSEIIKEYAVCLAFRLPIRAVNLQRDDSEHLCFELPKSSEQPLIAHYMFWDVIADFVGLSLPYIVPTLAELQSGCNKNSRFGGLSTLANDLACALMEASGDSDMSGKKFMQLQTPLFEALKNEHLLNSALEHVRNVVLDKLEDKINEMEHRDLHTDNKIKLVLSVISTGDLNLLKRVSNLYSFKQFNQEQIKGIMEFSKKYNNEPISDYLRDNLQIPFNKTRLKNEFLGCYRQQLQSDREAWYGWYSFFVKSHVNEEDSLQTLVQHAQGNSKRGTGERSRGVMKQLGWLDNSNKIINDDLEEVLDSYRT